MKTTNLSKKPVVHKILFVALYQLIAYILLMIVPIRLAPIRDPAIQLWLIIPIVVILFLLWVLFLVDEARYWVLGALILYGLAMLYTSNNALFYI